MVGLDHYLTLSAILFTLGIFGIFLNRKNVIVILMSIELMLLMAMLDGEGARVIEEAEAGFVAPAGDSAMLAKQVLRLMQAPDAERSRLGAAGLRYGEREFDRRQLVGLLESWFDECLAERALER